MFRFLQKILPSPLYIKAFYLVLSPLFATLSYVLLMQPSQQLSRLDCVLLLGSENYFRYFSSLDS